VTAASAVVQNGVSAETPTSAYDDVSPRTQDFSAQDVQTSRSLTPTSPQPSMLSEAESAHVAPLNTASSNQRVASLPYNTYASQPMAGSLPAQRSISMVMQNSHNREDSPVIHETLNVIEEHITDMSTPRSSVVQRALANDSGSEYSSHVNQRASYVHGDESDEDERIAFSEEEVSKWTSLEVARYLESIGVDRKHCDVFKEQEISGDILLGMDQSTIFMKEFDLGVVGRRLRTWHKIRSFQEQVRSNKDANSRAGDFFDEPDFAAGSQGSGTPMPRVNSILNRPGAPGSPQHRRQGSPFARPASQIPSANDSPISIKGSDFGAETHRASRRHSSIDFKGALHQSLIPSGLDTTPPETAGPHRKQPSLDRGWSLAAATAAVASPDSLAPTSPEVGSITPRSASQVRLSDNKAEELDRGYMSGGELDMKKNRNLLRKRDGSSAGHSRQSSFREENGNLAAPNKRHSRFGSAGSIRDTITSIATAGGRLRSHSAKDPAPTLQTARDRGPPLVTKLEYPPKGEGSTVSEQFLFLWFFLPFPNHVLCMNRDASILQHYMAILQD